jgi:hypothetical protein
VQYFFNLSLLFVLQKVLYLTKFMTMKKKFTFLFALLSSFFTFGQNLVVNGDFSDGLTSWSTFLADWEGVSANFSADNSEANITGITNAGGQVWWVQFNQLLTPTQIASLTVGQSYVLTFDARSNVASRALRMYFGENGGGFNAVHVQDYTITNTMTSYSASFTVATTYTDMKLGFEMGLSNDDVFIDNVVLQASSVSTSVPVTFRVDMADFVGTFTTPEVNGTFNNFCGNCAPMTNTSGSIWELTINLNPGTYEYLFSHDTFTGIESFDPGAPCTLTTGEFTNRIITVTEAVTLPLVCWNACVSCDLVSLESNDLSALTIYPNPSNGMINIQGTTDASQVEYAITDAQGRVIKTGSLAGASMNQQVDLSQAGAGIYFLLLSTQNTQRVERILIAE